MHFPVHLIFPLVSSFGYVLAVLLLKRSADWGVGIWRTTFISNIAMGVVFSSLLLLGGNHVAGAGSSLSIPPSPSAADL